jgi:hypothetical protein
MFASIIPLLLECVPLFFNNMDAAEARRIRAESKYPEQAGDTGSR